jgi:hypothetical protein
MKVEGVIKATSVSHGPGEETVTVVIELEDGATAQMEFWDKSWPTYRDVLVPGSTFTLDGEPSSWTWGKIPRVPG